MIRILSLFTAAVLWAVPSWAVVDIQEVTSPGGIKAWLVEDHSVPFTALEIRFKGGGALDAPGKRGAVNLMVGLLEEGAGDLDARAFAARSEALAARLGFGASEDSVRISAQVLTENRDAALAHLRLALVEPRFDPAAIERVRAQVQSILRSDRTDPNAIAGQTFDRLAWGAAHPYGSTMDGTPDSVAALSRDDLIDAHRGALALDRVHVGAVGDITAEELGIALDALLGDLPAVGAPFPDKATYQMTGGVTVVPFDTPQSVALFGHEGIARDDPDFFPAYILNQILGGSGFESRLMTEVREKRGLTYGVGSYLVPMDYGALYMGQLASDNAKMAEAIAVIRAQWADLAENGVTPEELEAAKTYLIGSYPLRFDGNGQIARILVSMQMSDLGLNYIPTRNAEIEAVTLDDVRRVAARILRPDDLRFVVVGQPEGLPAGN